MRSIEYDTMNDTYARFLRDEILPEVYQKYNIRKDAYSRGISGRRRAASARSTSPGGSPTSSAACSRGWAASPAFSGTRARSMAATRFRF